LSDRVHHFVGLLRKILKFEHTGREWTTKVSHTEVRNDRHCIVSCTKNCTEL